MGACIRPNMRANLLVLRQTSESYNCLFVSVSNPKLIEFQVFF